MTYDITEATLRESEYTLLLIDMPLQRETVRYALTRSQVHRVLDHGWIPVSYTHLTLPTTVIV